MLNLFVFDAKTESRVPVTVRAATGKDFAATEDWQTQWTTPYVNGLPNKVALCREDDGELLGLMSYKVVDKNLCVELLYIESARHSNANLLNATREQKKYHGIARALFAYAVQVSLDNHFGGVLTLRAKTDELAEYYSREFGAVSPSRYDQYYMIILEEAAARIIAYFEEEA